MRSLRLSFSILLMLTLAFQSCTIEKRHYTKGYHIQRNGQLAEKSRASKTDRVAHEQSDQISDATQPSDTLLPPRNEPISPVAATTSTPSSLATPKTKDTEVIVRRNGAPSAHIQKAWKNAFQSRRPALPDDALGSKEEEKRYSALAIASIIITVIAIFTYFLTILVISGWAALGYAILSILLALVAFVVGMIAILLDSKTERTIPILFYPFFGIVALVALITLLALLFSLI
jgi:hypothetical protein